MSTQTQSSQKVRMFVWLLTTTLIASALLAGLTLLMPSLPFGVAGMTVCCLYLASMIGWTIFSVSRGQFSERRVRWDVDDDPVLVIAAVLIFGVMGVAAHFQNGFSDKALHESAMTRVSSIHKRTGVATPVYVRVSSISSMEQIRENRDFLRQVKRSTYNQGKVLNFLQAGKILGFDTQYTQENYMIREQDYKNMYRYVHESASLPPEGVALAMSSM